MAAAALAPPPRLRLEVQRLALLAVVVPLREDGGGQAFGRLEVAVPLLQQDEAPQPGLGHPLPVLRDARRREEQPLEQVAQRDEVVPHGVAHAREQAGGLGKLLAVLRVRQRHLHGQRRKHERRARHVLGRQLLQQI